MTIRILDALEDRTLGKKAMKIIKDKDDDALVFDDVFPVIQDDQVK